MRLQQNLNGFLTSLINVWGNIDNNNNVLYKRHIKSKYFVVEKDAYNNKHAYFYLFFLTKIWLFLYRIKPNEDKYHKTECLKMQLLFQCEVGIKFIFNNLLSKW